MLDSRHHGDAKADPDVLPMLAAAEAVEAVPPDERRDYLRQQGAEALARAGVSWERLSGWVPGGMNARFRRAVRHRGHFPTEQAALKVLYLTATKRRKNRQDLIGKTNGWKAVLNTLTVHYGERITNHI